MVLQIQKQQGEAINKLEETYATLLQKLRNDHTSSLSDLKKQTNELFVGDQLKRMEGETKTNFGKLQNFINEIVTKKSRDIDDRMSKVKDGERGLQGVIGPIGPMSKEHIELMKEMRDEMEKVKNILSNTPRGKSMGRAKVPIIRRVDLTSQINGTTRSFTLERDTVAILGIFGSQFPFTMSDDDIIFRGNTLTLGDQVATPAAGQTLFVLAEVLFYP